MKSIQVYEGDGIKNHKTIPALIILSPVGAVETRWDLRNLLEITFKTWGHANRCWVMCRSLTRGARVRVDFDDVPTASLYSYVGNYDWAEIAPDGRSIRLRMLNMDRA